MLPPQAEEAMDLVANLVNNDLVLQLPDEALGTAERSKAAAKQSKAEKEATGDSRSSKYSANFSTETML